jgi:hypothetical protein
VVKCVKALHCPFAWDGKAGAIVYDRGVVTFRGAFVRGFITRNKDCPDWMGRSVRSLQWQDTLECLVMVAPRYGHCKSLCHTLIDLTSRSRRFRLRIVRPGTIYFDDRGEAISSILIKTS